MKHLIAFLLLLACALCAVAQPRVTPQVAAASHPAAQLDSRANRSPAGTPSGKADLSLFAAGGGALASLLFIWSPFGAAWRRRLGSRAELSALILALLLCGIMAVEGCGGAPALRSSSPVSHAAPSR
ncbi:MAG: hypothetical protein WB974_17820 [Acidobacteriaceae bacterium]